MSEVQFPIILQTPIVVENDTDSVLLTGIDVDPINPPNMLVLVEIAAGDPTHNQELIWDLHPPIKTLLAEHLGWDPEKISAWVSLASVDGIAVWQRET